GLEMRRPRPRRTQHHRGGAQSRSGRGATLLCRRAIVRKYRSRLLDLEDLVRRDRAQKLSDAARPADLDLAGNPIGAQAEVHALVRGAGVAHGGRLVVVLDASGLTCQFDGYADAVAVALAAFQSELEPVPAARRDVVQDFRRLPYHRNDHVDAAVVVEVTEGASPVRPGALHGRSGLGRHVAEATLPDALEQGVRLP